MKSLQQTFAPNSICFGCGPANDKGLKIASFVEGNEFSAEFRPEPHHEAFPGMLNGGIIGSLLDCHCNWAAAYTLMKSTNADQPPCTVTANYSIQLKRPTPSHEAVRLIARAVEVQADRVKVSGELWSNNKICATCEGLFVAVTEGHPAYHRWG